MSIRTDLEHSRMNRVQQCANLYAAQLGRPLTANEVVYAFFVLMTVDETKMYQQMELSGQEFPSNAELMEFVSP